MDTNKLSCKETKANGDAQLATFEMADPNNVHGTRPSGEMKKSGYLVTLMHLIKGNIGCGMLAMGQAFKCGGIAVTFFILFYVWLISVYNMHVLTILSKKVQTRLQSKRIPSFGETVENAFKMSDKWIFRKISNYVGKIVLYNVLITQLGLCSVYVVFIGQTLNELLKYFLRQQYSKDFHFALLLTMPLILVCASLRKLRFIAPLSTFANFALISGVITIMYYSFSGLSFKDRRLSYTNLNELPMMFGIIMFSFEGIGLVLPLFAEIKNDEKFTSIFGVLNFGMVAVMLLNVPLGMAGYMKWGDNVKSSLSFNLPDTDDAILTQFVKIMMMLGIACSYALQFYPAAVIVYSDLEKHFGPFQSNRRAAWDYSIRIGICLITYLAASIVPHLELFISLVGSVTCVALTMVFPALSNLAIRTKDKGSVFRTILDMITILTAVIGSVTGVYFNSTEIYRALSQNHRNG